MDYLTQAYFVLADKAYDADERVRQKLEEKKRTGLSRLIMIKIFIRGVT
jgi:hypothetical protein